MKELNKEQLKEMMKSVAKRIVEAEPYLTEIDLKIGDGDHGTGMKRGFLAVERMLETFCPRSCEEVFQAVGTCLLIPWEVLPVYFLEQCLSREL